MTINNVVRIQRRRGTAAQWASANPVLLSGEEGLETDTGKVKIGDGVSAWAALSYRWPFDPTNVSIAGGRIAASLTRDAATAVIFGDSITANCDVVATTQRWAQSIGYWTWANMLLGYRVNVLNYAGVSGNTTGQMLARMPTDVIAYNPSWVIVLGGINDIAGGISAAQIIANLQAIYLQALTAGIKVVACTILPSSLRITTPALHTLLHTVNQWIKDYCATTKGMALADFHAAFVDATTGAQVSTYTGDNLHPNSAGAAALGRCLADVLDPLVPKNRFLASSPTDCKNLIYNPLAAGNNASGAGGFTAGAGMSGNGPTGWTSVRSGTGAGVGSKVARTDYWQGEFARLALTSIALNDGGGWTFALRTSNNRFPVATYQLGALVDPGNGFSYRCTSAGTTAGGAAPSWPTTIGAQVVDGTVTWTCYDKPVAGDTMEAWIEFQSSGFSGAAIPYAYIQVLDGGSNAFIAGANYYNGDGLPTYVPGAGVLYVPRFVIPSTVGGMSVNLQIRMAMAAGVTGNLDVSRIYARITNR